MLRKIFSVEPPVDPTPMLTFFMVFRSRRSFTGELTGDTI